MCFKTCASLPDEFWTVRNFVEFDKMAEEAKPMLLKELDKLTLSSEVENLVNRHLANHSFTYKCEQNGIDVNGNDIYQLDLTIGHFHLHAKAFVIADMDGSQAYVTEHKQNFIADIDEDGLVDLFGMLVDIVEAEYAGDGDIPHVVKVEVTRRLEPFVYLYRDLHLGEAYLSTSTYQVGKRDEDVITIKQVVIASSDSQAIETVMENELECLTCVERNISKLNSLDAWVLGSQIERLVAAEL